MDNGHTADGASDTQSEINAQQLNAPIWFFYPQTGGIINFKRRLLSGELNVSNNQLTVNSTAVGQIVSCDSSEIKAVKRWAPVMTFYFKDGSKLQVDFHDVRENRRAFFGLLGTMSALASSNYKQALINIKPFEDYFTKIGLLK